MTSLSEAFLRALPESLAESAAPVDLEALLAGCLEACRLRWPALLVSADTFAAHLASKLTSSSFPSALEELRTTDLYLAFACLQRDRSAIAAFDDHCFPVVARSLSGMKLSRAKADDISSALREKVLFPKYGQRSPLAGYSGRGDLRGWLRAVAVRMAVKARVAERDPARAEADVRAFETALPHDNPEVAYLKAVSAAEFKAALTRAIALLDLRERNLLRQYALDGLNLDELAQAHGVHRATAARWLADVRSTIFKRVRDEMRTRHRISDTELMEAMQFVRSQLDVSLIRLLSA